MVKVMCAPDIGLGIMLDSMAAHYIQVDLFELSSITTSMTVMASVRSNMQMPDHGLRGPYRIQIAV